MKFPSHIPFVESLGFALHRFDGIHRTRLPMRDSAAARAAVPRLAHLVRAGSDPGDGGS